MGIQKNKMKKDQTVEARGYFSLHNPHWAPEALIRKRGGWPAGRWHIGTHSLHLGYAVNMTSPQHEGQEGVNIPLGPLETIKWTIKQINTKINGNKLNKCCAMSSAVKWNHIRFLSLYPNYDYEPSLKKKKNTWSSYLAFANANRLTLKQWGLQPGTGPRHLITFPVAYKHHHYY